MRILWYSNAPFVGSGYGNQTDLFVPRLKALGHDMAIAAYYGVQGACIYSDDIVVYPGSGSGGLDAESMAVPAHHFGADIIISLMDIWAVHKDMTGGIPYCPWFPVDSEPLMPPIAVRMDRNAVGVLQPIVFSRFAVEMMTAAGFGDVLYVPHGVDTGVYHPGDRKEARALVNLPQDDFIIGIVAANLGSPGRKAIKPQMMAFARLAKKYKDVRLYLHTRINPSGRGIINGENLVELAGQLGINDRVSSTDQMRYHFGLDSDEMRALYQSFDVLSNVSMGEGFGIPILEAQACGIPVIVGDWTSMSELNFSGWAVPKERAERWHTSLGAYQFWPSVDGIFEQMERAYLSTTRRKREQKARDHALAYDADLVTEQYWKPALEFIDRKLNDEPIAFEAFVNAK